MTSKIQKTSQKRNGKQCIRFRGKNVYFTNIQDLSNKLRIPQSQARKLLNDDGRRIVIDSNNNTLLINIKEENFTGLLKTNFGIGRIDNKKVTDDTHIQNKDIDIVKELGPNAEGKYLIKIVMYIAFNSNPVQKDEILTRGKVDYAILQDLVSERRLEEREITVPYNGYNDEIPKFIKEKIDGYMDNIKKSGGYLVHRERRIGSHYKNRKLKFEKGYVRELNNVYELTEWINLEYDNVYNGEDTCAVRIISKRYPNLYWDIRNLQKTNHGVKVEDFLDFCQNNKIGYNIYDERGNKKYSYEGSNGLLNCIIYNNHIYPTSGGKPRRFYAKEYILKFIDDPLLELRKILDTKKKLPSKLKIESVRRKNGLDDIEDVNITSYVIKNKKFIHNGEYQECLNILTKMGYAEHIYDNIRVADIPKLLEKILKVDDVSSFIPEKELFKTIPLLWKCKDKIKPTRVVRMNDKDVTEWLRTIDKNKCYAYCLYSLPYLIKFDYRKHKINTGPTKISDHYLYVAKPKYWSILMPKTKIYPGYLLKECKNIGIEFDLLEEMETEIVPNYFRKIIKLMYKNMSCSSFKSAINIFIGTFERNDMRTYSYDFTGIFTEEASDAQDGFYKKIGDYYLMFKENEQYLHVRDRIPIATQIKDMSRMILYKKIKELKIKDKQIVQINTDSISYYGELPKDLNPKKFDGWKHSEFKELGDVNNFVDEELSVKNIVNSNDKKRILHIKYAGSGKTTYIVENLVPMLVKNRMSYIVLTPTHTTLSELKKIGIKCEIMQKYVFNNQIPKEEYIIVDEIGFVDRSCHDLLYKIVKANKNLESFGDFNQLQPVCENKPYNQSHYLNYMFNQIDDKFINYRNNFTRDYYDSLISAPLKTNKYGKSSYPYLIYEVNKWSCNNMSKADYIICYRHKTKKLYNDHMLKELGFERWNEVGVKIVCTTNDLLEQKIYNHKQFIISDIVRNDEHKYMYTLKDSDGNAFILTEKKIFSYFEPAYAINIHQAQGMTLNTYYWASEDDIFLNGNVAYTIISRLRQKINFNLDQKVNLSLEEILKWYSLDQKINLSLEEILRLDSLIPKIDIEEQFEIINKIFPRINE